MGNKLADLYYSAKDAKYDYIRTGVKSFKEKSQKYYSEYKRLGGKKKL